MSAALGAWGRAVLKGMNSWPSSSSNGGVTASARWVSPEARPWPGKCLNTALTPAESSPRAKAAPYSPAWTGSVENDRSPTTSRPLPSTSSTGAKSTLIPCTLRLVPISCASCSTSCGERSAAICCGAGYSPRISEKRCTRPPSKSMETSKSRPTSWRRALISRPSSCSRFGSAQLGIKIPPTPASSLALASS